MVDIYSGTQGQDAYETSLSLNATPVDVPEGADADPSAGVRVKPKEGFGANFYQQFIQSYRRVGLGSFIDYEDRAYSEAYRELGAGGHLRAMGLQDVIPYGVSSKYLYDSNKDTIEKYIKENPELNLKTPTQIEEERIAKWKEDARVSEDNQKSNNFWSLGNLGALTGGLFGAMTDPINLLLSAFPAGTVVKGATIASQVPKLFAEMAAVSALTSVESKPRDIAYREQILGEQVDPNSLPLELLKETAVGAVAGTALIGAGTAIGRGVGKLFNQVDEGAVVRANPFEYEGKKALEVLEAKNKVAESNPTDLNAQLTGDEQDALFQLRQIDLALKDKPADISEADFVKGLANARAELEAPDEIIAKLQDRINYGGQPLTPDEQKFFDNLNDSNNPFRFAKEDPPAVIEDFDSPLIRAEDPTEDLIKREINDTIGEFYTADSKFVLDNYDIDNIPAREYFETFQKEQEAADALNACLTYTKPRIKA